LLSISSLTSLGVNISMTDFVTKSTYNSNEYSASDKNNLYHSRHVTISLSENLAVSQFDQKELLNTVPAQVNEIVKNINLNENLQIVDNESNQSAIIFLKENLIPKAIPEKIFNIERIRFNGKSLITENELPQQQNNDIELTNFIDNKLFTLERYIKNDFPDIFGKDLYEINQQNIKPLIIITNDTFKPIAYSIIYFVYQTLPSSYSTILVLFVLFLEYMLFNFKESKHKSKNGKKILSIFAISILIGSTFTATY